MTPRSFQSPFSFARTSFGQLPASSCGQKRRPDPPADRGSPKRQRTREPVGRPAPLEEPNGSVLWSRLPDDPIRHIAWRVAPPTYMGRDPDVAKRTFKALLAMALTHRPLLARLQPLLDLLGWSVTLARFWDRSVVYRPDRALAPPTNEDGLIGLLFKNPSTLNVPSLRGPRLDALLKCATTENCPGATSLLIRLFQAWGERHDKREELAHLALDELPLRLLQIDTTLEPRFLYEALGCPDWHDVRPDAPAIAWLMRHLKRFQDELRLFVCWHLVLLFENEAQNPPLLDPLWAAMRSHGIDEHDPILRQILTWNEQFLQTPAEQIDLDLARAVLRTLEGLPMVSSALALRLLSTFCGSARLRALAPDGQWTALIEQAMSELTPHSRRFDYLVALMPPELGVPAFARLPAAKRLRLIGAGCRQHHMPYVEALAKADDIPWQDRRDALLHLIAASDPDSSKRPRLLRWLAELDGGSDTLATDSVD